MGVVRCGEGGPEHELRHAGAAGWGGNGAGDREGKEGSSRWGVGTVAVGSEATRGEDDDGGGVRRPEDETERAAASWGRPGAVAVGKARGAVEGVGTGREDEGGGR